MSGAFEKDGGAKANDYLEAQKHYYKQLNDNKEELRRFQQSKNEHQEAIDLLRNLPGKTRHEVMVPFGDLAFMPGELVHTNEVLVLLGDNYFVERSAYQATEIVERRVHVIDDMINKTEKKVKDLAMRCDLSAQAREAVLNTLTVQSDPKDSAPAGGENVRSQARGAKAKAATGEAAKQDDNQSESEDDEEGKGPEYWRDAGFVGCFAEDVGGSTPDERGEDQESEALAAAAQQEDAEWDEGAPVLEIYEPLDGGESKIITHPSQSAFEQSPGFPY